MPKYYFLCFKSMITSRMTTNSKINAFVAVSLLFRMEENPKALKRKKEKSKSIEKKKENFTIGIGGHHFIH